jgi:hypothetical protein
VTSVAANATDDIGGEVALLGAVILAMSDLATVLTCLVFVITQCSVECGKFTKLVSLQFVLAFRNGSRSFDDIVDQRLGFVDFLFSIGHDETV